ncbi:DUF2309 domain-containing protein [Candidatus Nitrospira bockiana]
MATATRPQEVHYTEARRVELRALVKLAAHVVPPVWPLRTAIAINPLIGLEDLPFEDAVRQAQARWGARGYLANDRYRAYVQQGRITQDHIDAALRPRATAQPVVLGGRTVTHLEVLRAQLLHGLTAPDAAAMEARAEDDPDGASIDALAARLETLLPVPSAETLRRQRVDEDRAGLGRSVTLAQWCDRTLGTRLWEELNARMIRWVAAFVDEGHAAWPMPGRDRGLYGAWMRLEGAHARPGALPTRPEESVLESLAALAVPEANWPEYLACHLLALPGWTGHIKWRSEQPDPVTAEWNKHYPIDLVQYLAVRLWYERMAIMQACAEQLGIEGTYSALVDYMDRHPTVYDLRRQRQAGGLPDAARRQVDRLAHRWPAASEDAWRALAEQVVRHHAETTARAAAKAAAWRLIHLAKAVGCETADVSTWPAEGVMTLLRWLDEFPESEHGPYWLGAFEAGYQQELLATLAAQIRRLDAGGGSAPIRPFAQAVFCIDVRSERFRRHLEAFGGYETLGFAGFFICFIRYRALDRRHDVNSFPVIMKARNTVREIPRSAAATAMPRYRAGLRLLHTVQALLHDLKEHVITPYVMVESLGWFYSLPFLGKTLAPRWFKRMGERLAHLVTPPVATTLTVDKLSREEVEEMLAADQRAVIRRALRERLGLSGAALSPQLVEALRIAALQLDGESPGDIPDLPRRQAQDFLTVLRDEYRISRRWAEADMDRITQTGLTLEEQVFTVETALRMMGLTQHFGRLVAFLSHGTTMDNNAHESAYECGACGGNDGKANVRLIAAMANKPQVRERLRKNGLRIPDDTYFVGGQVDTVTDAVQLFDLEDVPATHRKDLVRFMTDLKEAGLGTGRERLATLPDVGPRALAHPERETQRRSADWSQIRSEWGLAGNAAIVVGRRRLTEGANLDGRVFLHSYDWREDPSLKALEIILTAPGQVMEWINMGYYFSTVDNDTFGAGNKIYHNVVGRIGVMLGTQSDLKMGLPRQAVMHGEEPYHEPMRPLLIVEAPRKALDLLIERHPILQRFYFHRWVRLVSLEPEEGRFYRYRGKEEWEPCDH